MAWLYVMIPLCVGISVDAWADEPGDHAKSAELAARFLQDTGCAARRLCRCWWGRGAAVGTGSFQRVVGSLSPGGCRRLPPRSARLADQAGLGIDRLAVDIGPASPLPYAESNDRRLDCARCHQRNARESFVVRNRPSLTPRRLRTCRQLVRRPSALTRRET